MYIRSYRIEKRRIDKYLKSAVSRYPWKRNMVKALKHISDHHGGSFMILIDHRSRY